jgi:hypothetical protein
MPFDPWNTDDGFPDDWFLPPSSSAPGTARPTFGASPNPFNSPLTSAPPPSFSPVGAQSTFSPGPSPFNPVFTNLLPPSHPLSPYFGLSPAEWLRAQAWMPPTFPDAFGRAPRPPLPPPPPIAASALFGDLTRRLLERTTPVPFGLYGNTAWHPAEVGDVPSIFGGGQFDSLANQQPAALSPQANATFAPPSDALASQSFIPPASLALSTTPPTFSAQPDPINPLLTKPPLPPFDIFSPYWSSLDSLSTNLLPPSFSILGTASPPLNSQPNPINPFLNIPPPQPFKLFPPNDSAFPAAITGLDRFGFTSDVARASTPTPPPVATSLLQPVGFQRTLSSPSQPGPPAPANGKLPSDQMVNGSNGPPVQVAAPPSLFDRLMHALSDSWTSIKSILDEPLAGPFTLGDAIAAGLLPIPSVGEVAEGADAAEIAAAVS